MKLLALVVLLFLSPSILCFSSLLTGLPAILPTAEVCIKGDSNGYDWYYGSRLGALSIPVHLGLGISLFKYSQGLIAPVTPLFSTLHLSLSTYLPSTDQTETTISSSTRSVKIDHLQHNPYNQYYQVLNELLDEMIQWPYSRNISDHNTTFIFLPTSSETSSSFHNYHYELGGFGLLRFIGFIFANIPSMPRQFPALWPWIVAKTQSPEVFTLATDVMIAQDVFTLSHTPDASFDAELDTYDRFYRLLQLIEAESSSNSLQEKMAYISSIRYGQQLYLRFNITSRAPPNKPYFGKTLAYALKDLLLEDITPEEFDAEYPLVSFSVQFPWEPLDVVCSQSGEHYHGVDSISSISAAQVIDITRSWRESVVNKPPMSLYPVALQSRNVHFIESKACRQLDGSITEYLTSSDEGSLSECQAELNNFEETLSNVHEEIEHHEEDEEQNFLCPEVITRKVIGRGEIVPVYTARCAHGNLPPLPVLEMIWELTFLTVITAVCLLTLMTYLTLGSLIHQLVRDGQIELPFLVQIHEAPVHLHLLYLWIPREE